MELNKKDALIGVGVVVGAAVLVIFMRGRNSASSGGNLSGGTTDIVGGFQTAGTVYVPTSSYDIQYNTYKGAVTYTTTNNETTTTYSGAPNPVPIPALPVPQPPTITTGSGSTINPVTKPPITKPKPAPAPSKAPAPQPAKPVKVAAPIAMGTMHYAVPSGGWNPNSVVDYIKQHGGYADQASRAKLAGEMGIAHYTGTDTQNKLMLQKLQAHYH